MLEMNTPVTITEILGRSEQGMTRPFVCHTDAWMTCYVKGAYAGQRSLCCEWVAGWLAKTVLEGWPLGVPSIAMAEVPQALIAGSAREDIRDLGAGTVFASIRIEGGQELSWSSAQGWSKETMAALLLLDLWIQNEDRSLSAKGGNPNLLVTQSSLTPRSESEAAFRGSPRRREKLWVYDFNLAFDETFDRTVFFDAHAFGGMVKQWPRGFRERMEPRLREALGRLPDLFAELPVEWLHLDGDDSLPVQLDVERVSSLLNLPFTEPDTFWKLP